MDQQHMLAGKSGIRKSMVLCALSGFFCLLVQMQAVAQPREVTIEIAEAKTLVQCDSGEHRLAIVKALTGDKSASAIGLALISPKGDVRMFARYSFLVDGKLLIKRDDDSGAPGKPLVNVKGISTANVDSFFKGCSTNKTVVLAEALNPEKDIISLEEIVKSLSLHGLEFTTTHPGNHNLTKPLTNDDGFAAFSATMRAALQPQPPATTPAPPPQGTPAAPARNNELAAIEKRLKEMDQKMDSVSGHGLLLTLLTVAVTLIAILWLGLMFLSYFRPEVLRGIFSDPQATTHGKILTERILALASQNANPKHGQPTDSRDNADAIALQKFIDEHFGKNYLAQGVETGLLSLNAALEQALSPLDGSDLNGLAPTFDRLKSACTNWLALQNACDPFKQTDPNQLLDHARESALLFYFLNPKFKHQTPASLRSQVESLLLRLNEIYNRVMGSSRSSSLSPAGQLEDLNNELKNLQTATETIKNELPNATGSIDQLASAVVDKLNHNKDIVDKAEENKTLAEDLERKLETANTQIEQTTQLAGALSHYVHLTPQTNLDSAQVQTILQKFTASEHTHRQLRLRLCAAVEALDRAITTVSDAGRDDVLDALKINDFKTALHGLLTNIEEFPGDALWEERLSAGFSQQWLHDLLRAELLARTYFADHESLEVLILPLSEASTALRAAIRQFQVEVSVVTLLTERPNGTRVRYDSDPKLREVPEVRQKVQARLEHRNSGEDPKFIVDVDFFPWKSATDGDDGRVVAINTFEWN